jgi:hypothetical protein
MLLFGTLFKSFERNALILAAECRHVWIDSGCAIEISSHRTHLRISFVSCLIDTSCDQ